MPIENNKKIAEFMGNKYISCDPEIVKVIYTIESFMTTYALKDKDEKVFLVWGKDFMGFNWQSEPLNDIPLELAKAAFIHYSKIIDNLELVRITKTYTIEPI